jgi:beta-N-acetylhexosaminidase
VFSIEGTVLNDAEKSLLSAAQPFGVILFGRNCESPLQVKKLTDDIRSIMGWHCPIMIDQEGGRVCRMKSPEWHTHPSARYFGEMMEQDFDKGAAELSRQMTDLAKMILKSGVDVNCSPVLDVLNDFTHQAIGDRAYSRDPLIVASAADIVAQAFLDEGVTPVIKHMPGHGRAMVDSHHDLPLVKASFEDLMKTDFFPFQSMAQRPYAESVWGMVAHIIYEDLDRDRPATLSPFILKDIIRDKIGFSGLLFSDDLDMKALESYGSIANRALLSLQAGCDIALYCWAKIEVMEDMAATLPPLSSLAWHRWQNGLSADYAA